MQILSRGTCFLLMACLPGLAIGQLSVRFQLTTPVATAAYVAGSFNGWNPADSNARFDANGRLVRLFPAGTVVAFKITQGSWSNVECSANGAEVGNRTFIVRSDTVIFFSIAGWRHLQASPTKRSTAASNVEVFDSAFAMKTLPGSRRITVYLPPNYHHKRNHRFGVLYLQDGQNCFDEQRANFGEWQVDETMNEYFDSIRRSLIVVAIDHGGERRIREYNPYAHAEFGVGRGNEYVDFLVKILKPAIDKRYRTLSAKAYTHVAGSSMGGLISCWAVMAYPQVFGSAGIFSPAFWVAPQLGLDAASRLKRYNGKLFFYAGGRESSSMVPLMDGVVDTLQKSTRATILRSVDAQGQHNELAWRRHFLQYLLFIL